MPFFVHLIISAVIGTVLGIVYYKLLSKTFSGGKRTVFCVLTMIIFIFSAISVSVVICAQSYAHTKIRVYSAKTEQYIYDTCSDNEFVTNGIDVNLISDGFLQVNDVISNVKTMIPSSEELNIDKKIYDLLVGYLTNELQNRFNAIANAVDTQFAKGNILVDKNGIITISSILSVLTSAAVKQVNIITLEIIIVLMLPLAIYIIVTVILAIIKAVSNKRNSAAITK